MLRSKKIILSDFKKFWITDTTQGSLITLCYGKDDRKLEVDCRWRDRKRAAGGRVVNKK